MLNHLGMCVLKWFGAWFDDEFCAHMMPQKRSVNRSILEGGQKVTCRIGHTLRE
jgi:hypothetical protein